MSLSAGRSIVEERRLEAAADWLLRLKDPAVSQGEIAEWLAWCNSDAENKQAFARMQSLWRESGALQERPVESAALDADIYSAQVPVREWRAAGRGAVSPSRKKRLVPIAVALAAAAALASIAIFVPHLVRDSGERDLTIAASPGVNRTVVLPDGTSVTVAGGSSLATRYSDGERRVFLERGEAFFQVEPDARRPFVVNAADATVTAIGTAFNVRAEAGMVRVAVTEGVVDVDRPAPAPDHRGSAGNIRLKAGHQVTLAENGPSPIVVSVDAVRATSWMTGTLQFADEPLSSVVAAMNRYATTPISLQDKRLGELRFTGTVVANRVDEWLRGLPNVFPVEVRSDADAGVLIAPAPGH